MSAIFLVTALLVIPAGILILIGDQFDPAEDVHRLVKIKAKKITDRTELRSRLEELGRNTEKEYVDFRIRQFGYCASSGALTFVMAFVLSHSLFMALISALLLSFVVFILIDRELTKAVKKRRELIESEFPAVIEMLTLAIAAGETPMAAILRIAGSADGQLSKEFQIVVDGVRSGVPINESLDALGRRVKSIMIRRFIDALVTATLRGAPLVEVLSRHAIEARANQRNRVMGAAGKAEISMMIPVVFLILPISILFALWPSLTNLNMFAS
jgi:tight adherence protein C